MTTREAIEYVADFYGVQSMYAMAKALSSDTLVVQTIQISNYLEGTKMSQKVAERFEEVYDIYVTDARRVGTFNNKPRTVVK